MLAAVLLSGTVMTSDDQRTAVRVQRCRMRAVMGPATGLRATALGRCAGQGYTCHTMPCLAAGARFKRQQALWPAGGVAKSWMRLVLRAPGHAGSGVRSRASCRPQWQWATMWQQRPCRACRRDGAPPQRHSAQRVQVAGGWPGVVCALAGKAAPSAEKGGTEIGSSRAAGPGVAVGHVGSSRAAC